VEYTLIDILLIPVAFAYIFAIIWISTKLKRTERISGVTARKVVHIGVGILVIIIPLLFSSYFVPFVVGSIFVIVTFLTCPVSPIPRLRFEAFKDGNGLGTVFYSVSLTTLIFLYFDQPWLIEVGFLPLVVGDAMANLGGIRYGNHKWIASKKSIEGTGIGLASTFVTLTLVLSCYYLIDLFPLKPMLIAAIAILVSIIAMLVELFSPYGLDNLTIPLFSVLVALQF